MCGGNHRYRCGPVCPCGTSPRVRGKRTDKRETTQVLRYIPACAGETISPYHLLTHYAVHPRVCGGNALRRAGQGPRAGTSPRVRGKPYGQDLSNDFSGYIPACAGETMNSGACKMLARVHPRVCGGNGFVADDLRLAIGTSPRVRGKLSRGVYGDNSRRYIPACAGETSMLGFLAPWPQVHPRVCGGNMNPKQREYHEEGTSPRVRGKLLYIVYELGDVSRSSVRQVPPDDV